MDITPIEVGDIVYCADFDEDHTETCWVNGLIITEIYELFPGRAHSIFSLRARFAPPAIEGSSHSVFFLRHECERCRVPDDVFEAMQKLYGDMSK
jgi:hypothetical protein